MEGYERLKSVGGGGRYDALASDGRTTYPGVGVSFGVSRTLVPLLAEGVLTGSRPVPERGAGRRHRRGVPRRVSSAAAAARCARTACPTEVAAAAQKFGKQIRTAERRGIPYVALPAEPTAATRSRTSARATSGPSTRPPGPHPTEDLRPQVVSTRTTRRESHL